MNHNRIALEILAAMGIKGDGVLSLVLRSDPGQPETIKLTHVLRDSSPVKFATITYEVKDVQIEDPTAAPDREEGEAPPNSGPTTAVGSSVPAPPANRPNSGYNLKSKDGS